jgi:hypothetical protein
MCLCVGASDTHTRHNIQASTLTGQDSITVVRNRYLYYMKTTGQQTVVNDK